MSKHCTGNFILRKIYAIMLPALFWGCMLKAQNKLSFDHLTVEEGLSQSTVFSIAQDSTGFMWFGTKDGLNRYDSKRIEIYKHNPDDTTSLSSSLNINDLLTDSKGNLWVGTQIGLNRYIADKKIFKRFKHNALDRHSLSHNTIRCIYEDNHGNIWVGTSNGLNKLHSNGTFDRYYVDAEKESASNIIKAIFQDHDGVMWIGTAKGLSKMVQKNGEYVFLTYRHDRKNPQSISGDDISSVIDDKSKNLWIGTRFNGLNLFDKENNTFTRYKSTVGNALISNDIRKITVDKNGKLWIGTLNGINIFDPVIQKFEAYTNFPEDPFSLNQNSIYDLFEDKAGSMWVGTYYGGVNVCHDIQNPFRTYQHYSYKNSISSNIISVIVEDADHNLWIATEAEGLNYYDRSTGRFTQLKHNITSQNTLSSNLIKAISIDKEGKLWIAAYESGLDVYNPENGLFRNYNNDKALSSNRLSSLLHDTEGRFWIGSRGRGLFRYNEATDSFYGLALPSKFIYHIYEDKQHTIWIAGDEGIYYLRKGARDFVKLLAKKRPSLLKSINYIYQDWTGKMWMGSQNDGLIVYDHSNKTIKIYDERNGLPANHVTAIGEDNNNDLWISTTRGLAKLTPHGFNIYTTEDGLPGNVFNLHSFLKDSRGELFFGGYNGLVSFFPESIRQNKKAPKVVLTKLRLFNKDINIGDDTEILPQSLTNTKHIELAYDQNVFSVEFSALNYIRSNKNRYAYKLDGIDKQWNYIDEPSVTFSNLSDGAYTLLVKGANNDGVWNDDTAVLKITVRPPFWKSWWAYIVYLSILLMVFFAVARYLFLRALLKKEHEINQQKLDFFTHVSHEIRTPLTLISGPVETLIQDTKDLPVVKQQLSGINKNVKRLLHLINELMDFRKIESEKLSLKVEKVDLKKFTQDIYGSFAILAEQRSIDYRFICKSEYLDAYFDKSQLEKVIFNLLSNAFKFVPDGGRITVDISESNKYFNVSVSDNGPGIPEESRGKLFTEFYQAVNNPQRNAGTGIGLALARRIALLHKGDLTLNDKEADTCFLLVLRKGATHFSEEELLSGQQLQNELQLRDWGIQPENTTIVEENTINERDNKPHILVVDDNIDIVRFIVMALHKKYAVTTCHNGQEALSIAQNTLPDIIISDVMMPVMDGFEFCNSIKSDERTSHIPVVLLTARHGDNYELEGLRTGADLYITKPFSVEKLQYHVDNLLGLKENIRKRFSQYFVLEPSNIEIESPDKLFIKKVMVLLEENIGNPDFSVNQFAAEIGMSTPIFYKKIKAVTGLTVNNFMKSIRLKRAAQLLAEKAGTVYEVAYMVGFNDPKYFSKEFRKQFGKTPSEYYSG